MYAQYAPVYRAAGWMGALPLPPGQKFPPPQGFTGWHSPDADDSQVQVWIETAAGHNIGLRMPDGVVGLDCDHYKDKRGLDTIALAEERWGRLPATWMSTAREGGSGIRFYRVPKGTQFPGKLELDGLSDVEIIQRGHRFAVAYPSVHPNGSQYRWFAPGSAAPAADYVPLVLQLAELPESWIQGLQSNGKLFGLGGEKRSLSKDDVLSELLSFNDALGDPCQVIADRLAEAIEALEDPGSRHDSALHHSMAIVGMGHDGHPGVITALEGFQKEFIARVSVDRGSTDAEFDRMILGAVAKLSGDQMSTDPCETPDTEDDPTAPTEEEIEAAVKRMRIKEEAKIRFNNILAGDLEVPEFESAWQVAQAVPDVRDWLLDGLIPRRGVVGLSAAKKTGKSTIVHKIVQAMIDETLFLDKFQGHKPNGSVHIIDLELDKTTLGPWLTRNGIARREGVFVSSLYGHVTDLNIYNMSHRKAIAESLREQNCKFLIIDPIGPYLRMLGAEEDSTSEVGRAVDALVALKEMAEIDTLLMTMHSGHAVKNRARGASVLLDTPDVNINIHKKNENDDERHLSAEGRDVDVNLITFTYDRDTGELQLQGADATDAGREPDVQELLSIVSDIPGIIQSRLVSAMNTRVVGCGKKRAMSALEKAVRSGFVRAEKTADSKTAPIAHFLTAEGKAELDQVRRVLGEAA